MKNQFIFLCGALVFGVILSLGAPARAEDAPPTPPVESAATPPAETTSGGTSEPDPTTTVPAAPVRAEITVQQLSPIEFGSFASDVGGGSVTVSPAGARTLQGNISTINGGAISAAQFEIIGEPGEAVVVYLPEQGVLSNNAGRGEATMTGLIVSPSDSLTLDTNGRARISIGATLQAPDSIVPGAYGGYFDIDVRYLN